MGIPDWILPKPGPSYAGEWEIMRKHPVYDHGMLVPIAHLRPALDIPNRHHESGMGAVIRVGLKGE